MNIVFFIQIYILNTSLLVCSNEYLDEKIKVYTYRYEIFVTHYLKIKNIVYIKCFNKYKIYDEQFPILLIIQITNNYSKINNNVYNIIVFACYLLHRYVYKHNLKNKCVKHLYTYYSVWNYHILPYVLGPN